MSLTPRFIAAAAALLFASPVLAAKVPAEAPDARRMWEQFLATADDSANNAYDVMELVGYDVESVEAERCAAHRERVQAAVAQAPVSLAIRRVAFLCAEAVGDADGAEREMALLAALSRHALAQAGTEPGLSPPIRVQAIADAYALVETSGMDFRYAYYEKLQADRDFPLVLAAWDEDARRERRLRFDFLDTGYELRRSNALYGYPLLRTALADAYVESGVGSDLLVAVDVAAVRAAAIETAPEEKVAKLRRSASAGGLLSTVTWLLVCRNAPRFDGCADGLVDAILPSAEEQHALPLVLLSLAHLEGVGVDRNQKAAWKLLDDAVRIAPDYAWIDFIAYWQVMHGDAPLPKEVAARLDGETSSAVRIALLNHASGDAKASWDEGTLAFLRSPAVNRNGDGYRVLAKRYEALGDEARKWEWTLKAASAGQGWAQARHAEALLSGEVEGIPRDVAKAEALLEAAAHGGDTWAARYLADRRMTAGDFAGAERWLVPAAESGDGDALLMLAGLYEYERPGVTGDVQRALAVYNAWAEHTGPEGAPARRALATMALDGRGMAKDPAKARAWLLTDARRGDHDSAAILGYHLLEGTFGKTEEAEGRRWMQGAIDADNEWALTGYAGWLYRKKDTPESRAEAIAMLKRGDAEGMRSATNNLAWELCTTTHDDIRDPAAGLEASRRLGHEDRMDAGWLDTVAACEAAVGNFERALALQERAAAELAVFDTSGKDEVPGYQQRLSLFRERKPWRQHGDEE